LNSTAPSEAAPAWFSGRVALLYCVIFLHTGLYLPYFPIWLKSHGLDPTQIAIVLTLPLFVRIATALHITAYADRAADRANVIVLLYWLAALAFNAYWFSTGFWSIAAVTIAASLVFNPIVPVLDSLALSGVRRYGVDYGVIRARGSMVFVLANVGGGFLLAGTDVSAIMLALIASLWFGAMLSPLLPRIGRPRRARTTTGPADSSTWKVLADRRFLIVQVASGMLQASHALIYGFGSIWWQSIGIAGTVIGALWATGVFAEIVLFRFGRRIARHAGPVALIAIGGVGAILRWTLMPAEPPLIGFFALQMLHGLSFGAVHLGTMHFLAATIDEERLGAAQGASFVIGGATMAVATLSAGPLYAAYGADAFFFMAAGSALALGLLWLARGIQPQKPASGGETSEAV